MTRVELAPAAITELTTAVEHYEAERPGRGLRLAAAVERSLKLISGLPKAGSPYRHVRTESDVRRLVVRGFPFVLAYRVLEDRIRIDAVMHMHRRPGYWHSRLR